MVYDGPDLAEVARLTGLSAGEVAARHAAGDYTVGWLGFSPGFGYLTGLDPVLATVPRLAEPRLRVPAGTVAIAARAGRRLPQHVAGRMAAARAHLGRPVGPAAGPAGPAGPGDAGPLPRRRRPPGRARPAVPAGPVTPAGAGPVIEVVRPGPLATIQDLGRPGFGHLGVPHSGAADAASLRRANRLAGNPDGAAGIELTLGRAALRFLGQARVAVTGAPAPVTLTGPGGAARDVPHGRAFGVPAGGLVRVGAPAAGLRSYVAVRGGIDVPPVLGSRSADLRSGLGPAPLRAGDLLPVGAPGTGAPGDRRPRDGRGHGGRRRASPPS